MMNSARNAFGFAVVLCGAAISHTSWAQGVHRRPPAVDSSPERKTMILSKDVGSALRAEAGASEDAERLAAVERLSQLHHELAQHGRFPKSQLLQHQRRRIEIRLLHVYERIASKKGEFALPGLPENGISAELAEIDIAGDLALAGQIVGQAAGRVAGDGNRSIDSSADYSVPLIEIISRTIAPDAWESVGGTGAIRYYRQGMALVVRAPQAAHNKMVDLLAQMRATGR